MTRTRLTTAAVALLALAAVLAPAVAGSGDPLASHDRPTEATGAADHVYVSEDGSAVLVYETDPADPPETLSYGLDVEEGLAYGRLADTLAESTDLQARVGGVLTGQRVALEGSLDAPAPGVFEALSVSLSAIANDRTSEADASLDARFPSPPGLEVRGAHTNGSLTQTASSAVLTGSASVTTATPAARDLSLAATLTERDEAYVLSLSQRRVLPEYAVKRYATRAAARRTVSEQFAGAALLGATPEVTVDRYALEATPAGQRLTLEYTVTLAGLEAGLSSRLVPLLQRNPRVSAADAQAVADALASLQIDEASVSLERADRQVTAAYTLEVEGYGDALVAYARLADALNDNPLAAVDPDRVEARQAAREAARLEQTTTWSGTLTRPSAGDLRLQGSLEARAENYAAYREQLARRGVPTPAVRTTLAADLEGDRLTASGSYVLRGEDLLERGATRLLNATRTDGRAARVLGAVRDADLRKAKVNASVDGDAVRLEAGAAVRNLAGVRDALAATADLPAVTRVVGRQADGAPTVAVHVADAVPGNATEGDVRDLGGVGPETAVHMPGSWDRSFAAMDTRRAVDYLGLDAGGAQGTSAGGPGFGVIAAGLALLAVALLGRRRA